MYTKTDPTIPEKLSVEKCCYEEDHIKKVTEAISSNFNKYFDKYIASEGGAKVTYDEYLDIQEKIGITPFKISKAKINYTNNFRSILISAIEDFEKDQQRYIDIFDPDALEEYYEDPALFKSDTLKKDCPVIRKTLNNDVKELKKYKMEFGAAKAIDLLSVVDNISRFATSYYNDARTGGIPEHIKSIDDLKLSPLDKEDKYTAYGVIGGGIKSHMLFKNYPSLFANRSQSAIWALYYLTDQKTFDCINDSEFLMIDIKKSITQQNYFYPYELFSYYANIVYELLCNKAKEYEVYINPAYKFVAVDSFLTFIASEHKEHINMLKTQIEDGGTSYAYA